MMQDGGKRGAAAKADQDNRAFVCGLFLDVHDLKGLGLWRLKTNIVRRKDLTEPFQLGRISKAFRWIISPALVSRGFSASAWHWSMTMTVLMSPPAKRWELDNPSIPVPFRRRAHPDSWRRQYAWKPRITFPGLGGGHRRGK